MNAIQDHLVNADSGGATQRVIEGVAPPPAPKRTDAMVKAAVVAYIERHSLHRWGVPDEAASDIAETWRLGMDGYELAKALEYDFGWDGLCLQDAEDLDSIDSVVRDAEEEARKAWVAEWDIKPPYPIGTKLTRGVIASVSDYMSATYLVKENGCTHEGRHLVVKFEDAKPVAA